MNERRYSTMAPKQVEEVTYLRERLAALETELQRQNAKRRTGEERFRLLADAAPVMMWMSDTDAMTTFFNRRWLEFRGRSMEEEIGNGWSEGLHPDERDLCLETYLNAFASHRAFRMEHRMRRADGEYCW